ncbi:large-conductance mechanosensitive channel protein MscL [Clostridium sp. CM028]|uniref:large-conductance mechanosensitive channel protein MscL n=1 Tax=unclassified Clostridium TaxID=2614128 RepID=UPI001C0ACA21|nr:MULTISPECIES: large-conductance mechanosensitive channel protein MscL [unclassified Clostridium]MBU3091790.1 large-conductance mechanosensitive channel protein MscL [Clostridium sp. CF011]MBW9145424.1 large-conductance mechanosensitive channel protein MscL [Clostridium sp. CM027]MBW9148758.1 large-conductance mechanosensitive channel protein MscL [Clostridium sp. CM028]UVE39404.1 large-conductance mechanosensitive channel protein MscL [Clostridium sp. CM027]WAG68309.1 large-conductance mech
MLKEFKKFALKGSVLDLAIAVVIGAAFSKIVTSLVNEIIMPFLGILMGGINFSSLQYDIPSSIAGGVALSIKYGLFIQSIIDFLIIAFSLFIFIKAIQSVKKKEIEKIIAPKISNEEVLLSEIRDLLQQRK